MRRKVFKAHCGVSRTHAIRAVLTGSAALLLVAGAPLGGRAHAQSQQAVSVNIRSQDLGTALTTFADQAGIRLLLPSGMVAGRTSPALSGTMTREQALSRLLAGTGLSYQFTSANTVTITDRVAAAHQAPVDVDGSIALDTISVTGGAAANPFGTGYTPDTPYETAGSVDYKTEEQLQRFRGTSAGDIFKGIPGVLTGEARNSGAVDVNIRGMQGQGRVPVVVDGATQETTIYHGYNGSTARTYIDPDFIGSMSIEKGASIGADATGATGGVVRMSTLNPEDILLPGKSFGVRLKGGFATNSSSVPAAATPGGYQGVVGGEPTFAGRGLDRPAFLEPTGGSGSAVLAATTDHVDFVGGYVRRTNGNYFAGKNGGDGAHIELVPNQFGTPTWTNVGLTNYRAGEEVLNTSQDTTSYLLKGRLKLENGHSLELGYSRYESEYGHVLATQAWGRGYQGNLSTIDLDTYTARYRWKPDDSDLIDLKVDGFLSKIDNRINSSQNIFGTMYPFLVWIGSERYGFNASNTSRFDTDWGDVSLTYGGGFTRENVGLPDGIAEDWYKANGGNSARHGSREEWSGFAALEYKPLDWLTLNGSLRYQDFYTLDRGVTDVWGTPLPDYERKADGWSPIASVTVEPLDGVQLYGKYGSVIRSPSIFESLQSFSFLYPVSENPIDPERANTWEIGLNYLGDDFFFVGDKLRLHAAYFDNYIDGYITRSQVRRVMPDGSVNYNLGRLNLDYARMRGFEISAEYDTGKYFGGISWNHYTHTMFCAPEGITDPAYGRCGAGGIYNSFVLQMVPPKDMVTVNLGVRFLDDKLILGGRFTYIGSRMAEGMGNGLDPAYQGNLINASTWKPYGLVDLYASYKPTENLQLDLAIDNLTDRYYMDALNVTLLPAPGRTVRGSLTVRF